MNFRKKYQELTGTEKTHHNIDVRNKFKHEVFH